jgi:hypothetical protein
VLIRSFPDSGIAETWHTPASTYDYDYDALLERISQEAQPGSDQALIAATAQIARGSVRSSKEGEGREGTGTEEKVRIPTTKKNTAAKGSKRK